MRKILLLLSILLLSACVSKRKTVSEVMQIKTEEITSETTREERKTISEWIKELSGSIVISEVEYYPPTDTVQPSPQRYGAVKAERKVVVQLDTTEQSTTEMTEVSTSSKVATRDEEMHRKTKISEKIKDHKSGVLRYIIIIFVISALFVVFLRPPGFPK